MSNRIAPNGNYWRYQYQGASGPFYPLPVVAAGRLATMQAEVEDQIIRGQTIGSLFKNQPLPTGTFTVLDIQTTPTNPSVHDMIVNGDGGFTGTNTTITNSCDSLIRLVTLRVTCDMRNIQQGGYYQDITGVELRFAPNPTEAESGNTWEITSKVYGTIGAVQSL